MKRILVAGVLGGITVFIWGMISWMVLPWHNTTMNEMANGASVSQNLAEMNVESGIYMYPKAEHAEEAAVAEAEPVETTESEAAGESAEVSENVETTAGEASEGEAAATEEPELEAVVASKEGAVATAETETSAADSNPFIFMLYVSDGANPANMTSTFIGGFILAVVSASLAAYLLSLVVGNFAGFRQRMTFVTLIGLFAALISHVSAWNWMMFPTDYTVVMALDMIIGWALAGAVIAWRITPADAAAA